MLKGLFEVNTVLQLPWHNYSIFCLGESRHKARIITVFVENSPSSWAPMILTLALLLAPASTFFFCKALVEMLFFLRQLIVFIISTKDSRSAQFLRHFYVIDELLQQNEAVILESCVFLPISTFLLKGYSQRQK